MQFTRVTDLVKVWYSLVGNDVNQNKASEPQIPVSRRWLIMTKASSLHHVSLSCTAWGSQPCHKRCSLEEVSLFMDMMMNGGLSTSGWRLFICERFLCPEPAITRLFCYFTSLFSSHPQPSRLARLQFEKGPEYSSEKHKIVAGWFIINPVVQYKHHHVE